MGLISIDTLSMSYGGPPLLDGVTLQIEQGERIGLLGRNGSGKSTLLKIIHGDMSPDGGRIAGRDSIRTSLLPQDVPEDLPGTVYDVVSQGGSRHLDLLREYHDLTMLMSQAHDDSLMKRLEDIQHHLEATDAWSYHQRIETVLERTSLDGDASFSALSAGRKRMVFLARALVSDPDVLLLDEPTNHLDIDSIIWLENLLLTFEATIIFVTHDRSFLQRLATRIVEIDRGRLLSFSCDYPSYL
ncbi:ATP-binding cassette domain-containing protein, partial [archaeon]|nr:ATP-binding cassette domain-containing protein [archaeon]